MASSVRKILELESFTAELRDGTTVIIRPIRSDDKRLLADGFERLSERSRHRRFGMVVRKLSAEQLKYLTEIDHENHMAWLAIDSSGGVERAVGVARYVRLDNDPTVAEVAVTVADSHQSRGLGTILLARLAKSARENGLRGFLAFVTWENVPVLKLVRELGAAIRSIGSGMFRVTGPVPESLEGIAKAA